jgi:hypothetical protein
MSKYAKTKDVKIAVPMAIYNEMIRLISTEDKWAYPQNFVIDAINEKIEKLRKEHQTSGVQHKKS